MTEDIEVEVPLKHCWVYEVIDDALLQKLLIIDDVAKMLEACGYPEELAGKKSVEVWFRLCERPRQVLRGNTYD